MHANFIYFLNFSVTEYFACRGDTDLQSKAIKRFIEVPYAYGQDKEFGGLYYFLDTDGYCPTQLEWSMKLWWVHCEAMIAFLMAYEATGDKRFWTTFLEITEYTLSKVRTHVYHNPGINKSPHSI